MDDGKIINLEEVRRIRKQTEDSLKEQKSEFTTASVQLVVRGKDLIDFTIDGNTFTLTEEVARSWATHLRRSVNSSIDMGESPCVVCERHACRLAHPRQKWRRKSDGRWVTIEAVFGARIQLLHESGRITTITGLYKLKKRYLGPWEWPKCNYTHWK